MAIAVRFEIPGLTQAQYDAIIDRLQARGAMGEGRKVHIACPSENGWFVLDVWESPQALDRVVQSALGPIFQELGVPPPAPTVTPVHNLLFGPEHHL
jgi:hypothetical protein